MAILTPDIITERVAILLRESLNAAVNVVDADCNAETEATSETPPIPDSAIYDGEDTGRDGDLTIEIMERAPEFDGATGQPLALHSSAGMAAGTPYMNHVHGFRIRIRSTKQTGMGGGTARRILWRVSMAIKFLLYSRTDLTTSTYTTGIVGAVELVSQTEPEDEDETRAVLLMDWTAVRGDFQ